jgi:hypothetical protein
MDDALFATAGVSKRIKIFDFRQAILARADKPLAPVLEVHTRSKLSCLSWSKGAKSLLASSDYDAVVSLWDTATSQCVLEYEEVRAAARARTRTREALTLRAVRGGTAAREAGVERRLLPHRPHAARLRQRRRARQGVVHARAQQRAGRGHQGERVLRQVQPRVRAPAGGGVGGPQRAHLRPAPAQRAAARVQVRRGRS